MSFISSTNCIPQKYSAICSNHFIGKVVSNKFRSPSYIPSDDSQRGRVVTHLLRLCFFLGESKLQTPSLRTPDEVDTAVSTLTAEIKNAKERSTNFQPTIPKRFTIPDRISIKIGEKKHLQQIALFSRHCSQNQTQPLSTQHQILYSRCSKLTLLRLHVGSGSTCQWCLEGHQKSSQPIVANPTSRIRREQPLKRQGQNRNL